MRTILKYILAENGNNKAENYLKQEKNNPVFLFCIFRSSKIQYIGIFCLKIKTLTTVLISIRLNYELL